MQLLQDILARRAEAHLQGGCDPAQALERARAEVLDGARGRLAAGDMFCLKVCLRGACRNLAPCALPAAS
ncbi:MAG: hypothetical protein ACOCVM_08850 [Desulfovibrionaceae bacterium]